MQAAESKLYLFVNAEENTEASRSSRRADEKDEPSNGSTLVNFSSSRSDRRDADGDRERKVRTGTRRGAVGCMAAAACYAVRRIGDICRQGI